MKKLSKKAVQAAIDAQIQNAVYGFQIPMLTIPALYKELALAVAAGKSDAELKAVVAAWPGVTES